MTFKSYILAIISLGGGLWLNVLHAQTPQEPFVGTIHFRMLGWNDYLSVFYTINGGKIRVNVDEGTPSAVQTYTGKSPLILYTNKKGVDGKSVAVPVANVTFDKNANKFLLVFIHNRDDSYASLVIPDQEDSLAPDQTRILNASPVTIALDFAGTVFQLKPGESKTIPSKHPTVFVKSAYDHNGKWQNAGTSYVDSEPGDRSTVIISNPQVVHFEQSPGAPPSPPLIILTLIDKAPADKRS